MMADAVITDISVKTKGEIFRDKLRYGEPFERVLRIRMVVFDGRGRQIGYASDILPLSYSPRSKYGKMLRHYGELTTGMTVKVQNDKGWWKLWIPK